MAKRGAVTIKDIASRLNVSLSTVNKALTGKSGVGDECRARVIATAEEMGYTVNHAAQTLSRRRLVIGVVLPSVWQQFFGGIEKGMLVEFEALAQSNIEKWICCTQNVSETEKACRELIEARVDALIYCPSILPMSDTMYAEIQKSGIPLFLAGSDLKEIDAVCTVCINGYLAGEMAADLFDLALPRGSAVAVFTGTKDIKVHVDKVRAFASKMAVRHSVVAIFETQDDPQIAEICAKRLFQEHPEVRGIYISTATAQPILRYATQLPAEKRPMIVTTDVYDEVCDAMRGGIVAATVFQNQVLTGRLAVRKAYEYLIETSSYHGKDWTQHKAIWVNPHLYFPANLRQISDDTGNDYLSE